MLMKYRDANFIDPLCIQDVFVTDLALIEDLGGVFRYTWVSAQNGENVVTARLSVLASSMQKARLMTAEKLACSLGKEAMCVCPLNCAH